MNRYKMLDECRGAAFLSMALYHGMWDLVYIFGKKAEWYVSLPGYIWQQSICWLFIFLSGFCWSFGKEKYKRSLMIFGAGGLISLVTCLTDTGGKVLFGILTFLGTASFLTAVLRRLLRKCPALLGSAVSMFLFLAARNVNRGVFGFETWQFGKLPEKLYQNLATAFLGFPPDNFYSADYFPVFPWIFLYLAGYFLFRYAEERKEAGEKNLLEFLKKGKIPVLGWIGRHSLILYMLHQPVILAALSVLRQTGAI